MPDEWLTGRRMLALGEPPEVFFADLAGETPAMRQLAIPHAANHIAFGVVVLPGVLNSSS